MFNLRMIPRAGERTQWLKVCTILAEFNSQHSKLPVTPVLEDLLASTGTTVTCINPVIQNIHIYEKLK